MLANAEWHLLQPPADTVDRLAAELGVSATLATVLANRGVADPAAAAEFLEPSLSRLHDPLAMRGMADAVYTVAAPCARGGASSSGATTMSTASPAPRSWSISCAGTRPTSSYHIPHRIDDGYGLDAAAIRRHADAGVSLIVTVDCGISSAAEIREARALGVDVVVTDHHEPPGRAAPGQRGAQPAAPRVRLPLQGPRRRRHRLQARPDPGAAHRPRRAPARRRAAALLPRPRRPRHGGRHRPAARRKPGAGAPRSRAARRQPATRRARAARRRPGSTGARCAPPRSASGWARGSTPPAASTAPTPPSISSSPTTCGTPAVSPTCSSG